MSVLQRLLVLLILFGGVILNGILGLAEWMTNARRKRDTAPKP